MDGKVILSLNAYEDLVKAKRTLEQQADERKDLLASMFTVRRDPSAFCGINLEVTISDPEIIEQLQEAADKYNEENGLEGKGKVVIGAMDRVSIPVFYWT